MKLLRVGELVMPGHPDKLADQIADAVLDAHLAVESWVSVAVEVLVMRGKILIAGEVSPRCVSDREIEAVVRQVVCKAGYIDSSLGLDGQKIPIEFSLFSQSSELKLAHDKLEAGDQSVVYGYAVNENPSLIPAPMYYARSIVSKLLQGMKEGAIQGLGPDGKILVSLWYDDDTGTMQPVGLHNVVVSLQHRKHADLSQLASFLYGYLQGVFPSGWLNTPSQFHFNRSGSFILGGPAADTGVTGRKIIADSYGPGIPSGGGAYSGKDPTKVDRSGAYMARYLAKNLVLSGLGRSCLTRLSYEPGNAFPLSGVYVEIDGRFDLRVCEMVSHVVDLSLSGVIKRLRLLAPMYLKTAECGHFGVEGFSWERGDLKQEICSALGMVS